jgi:hypothetical protein
MVAGQGAHLSASEQMWRQRAPFLSGRRPLLAQAPPSSSSRCLHRVRNRRIMAREPGRNHGAEAAPVEQRNGVFATPLDSHGPMAHHVIDELCGRPHLRTLSLPPCPTIRCPARRATQPGRVHCERGRAFRAGGRSCRIPGLATFSVVCYSAHLFFGFPWSPQVWREEGRERRATGRWVPWWTVPVVQLPLRFGLSRGRRAGTTVFFRGE